MKGTWFGAWLFILLPKWVVQLRKEFLDHFHPQIQVVKKLQVPTSSVWVFSRGVSGPLGPNKFCHFDLLADNLVLKYLGPLPRIIPRPQETWLVTVTPMNFGHEFRPFGRGTTTWSLEDLLTMLINHLHVTRWSSKYCWWFRNPAKPAAWVLYETL